MRETLKDFIFELCAVPSVSGFEARATGALCDILDGALEHVFTDGVGNHVFVKRCGRQDAPRVLIDAHMDEIGMMVTDVCDGGFLRVAPLGGIDPSIMQAADVIIYGKEVLRGVIVSTPPHLRDGESLPAADEMLVDTGLSKKRAEELIPLGTPIAFSSPYGELLNGRIVGKCFDDKAPAACALWGVINTPAESLAGDVYVMLSAVEETNRVGGVAAGAFSVKPDYAMVIDVNLARVPDTKAYETVEMDKGISLSVSAATDVKLTRKVEALCVEREIPHTMIAAPSSTGTNAISLNLTEYGIPTVDVGLPLASMHTYNELISMNDCDALVRLVEAFITSRSLAESMTERGVRFL